MQEPATSHKPSPGRPRREQTDEETLAVLREYHRGSEGVVAIANRMRRRGGGNGKKGGADPKISNHMVHRTMRDEGLLHDSPGRPRKPKYVRFERRCSNAMWHVDLHMIKGDSRLARSWLVAYLDDASRCITGFGVLEDATSENVVLALRSAIMRYGAPAQLLSDHGPQFTSNKRRGEGGAPRGRGKWKPTVYEQELMDLGIQKILARVNHPQTNGKLERFFRTFEEKWEYHGGIPVHRIL